MSRERKKTSAGQAAARRRDLARQAAQDAIGALKGGISVTVRALEEERLGTFVVRPFSEAEQRLGAPGEAVLCLVNRRLWVLQAMDKDGFTVTDNWHGNIRLPCERIYGVVVRRATAAEALAAILTTHKGDVASAARRALAKVRPMAPPIGPQFGAINVLSCEELSKIFGWHRWLPRHP